MNSFRLPRKMELRHEKVILSNKQQYKILYDYWDSIPAVKSLYDVEDWIYDGKTIRLSVIRALSKGYQESDNLVTSYSIIPVKRHCFHPQELLEIINSSSHSNNPIKLPNLYFHLDVLEKNGLIKPVCVLSDGRYNLTYYGRTAKLFLFRTSNNEFDQVLLDQNLVEDLTKFVRLLGLDYSKNKIVDLVENFKQLRDQYEKRMLALLQEKGDLMYDNQINAGNIFVLMTHLFTTTDTRGLINKIDNFSQL